MKTLLKGAQVFRDRQFSQLDILIDDGRVVAVSPEISTDDIDGPVLYLDHFFVFPAFADIHVHLREPGYSYKATIETETRAALKGGFTTLVSMPNLNPPPDSLENLQKQLDIIEQDAQCDVLPLACITQTQKGEALAEMEEMAPYVVGYSDDGWGVQNNQLMREGFLEAKRLGKPIVSHCEVEELVRGGVIHDGDYAREHHLPGNPSESEWRMVERDLKLVEETGAPYHICHVSTKETVALVREAKAKGLPVTCETAPHYLYFTDNDLQDEGRFKMNPPIRGQEDQDALIAGLVDGTVDALATDHAPHSAEEKSKGLLHSANGIIGLETAFAASYTSLVAKGHMRLEDLVEKMSVWPRQFLGLPAEIEEGFPADLVVVDLLPEYKVAEEDFLSMGKASPFTGETLKGQVVCTIYKGKKVWEREN